MRRFYLNRLEDISGVSGTGRVAEGVLFHDGQYVISWFGQYHTVEVGPSINTMIKVHGHQGRTVVEWEDDDEQPECCIPSCKEARMDGSNACPEHRTNFN